MTHLKQRVDRARALCDPVPDAFLFESGGHGWTDPNFGYVTGVEAGLLSGATVLLRPGERAAMVVSRMEAESAEDACARSAGEGSAGARRGTGVEIIVTRTRREHDQAVVDALTRFERVGYNPHGLSAARFRALSTMLPGIGWVDVSQAFLRARLVKTPDEIERMRDAARITAETMADVPSMLVEGMRERDLAAELNLRLHRRGASRTAFDTIVAFGRSASEPHHLSGDVALADGCLVLVDMGAVHRGYSADCTRTFAFGRVGDTETRMHAVVAEAHEAALAALGAGRPARAVHEAAEQVIQQSEFRDRFVHAVGHSVGIEAQDGWVLHGHAEFVVEPGMVFAVEPGVYVPGTGGVRIEDTVGVTGAGVERWTDVPYGLTGAV